MKKPSENPLLSTKEVRSRFSGLLQVTWSNGRKVLNCKNANYSYGALERVLETGLEKTTADRSAEVLVLGLGGGSVLGLLRDRFRYYGKITAVEIDPAVIDIAVNEFHIREHDPLDIICEDALEYVRRTSGQFGLIIIDIFIHLLVPPEFYSLEFWNKISDLLQQDGKVIFNAGINSANIQEIQQLQKEMKPSIEFKKLEHINGANTLLLGTKK